MKTCQGVAITDGINRKNHIMPLSTIIKAYCDSWNTIIPMNLGHDRTKPIGYTYFTGVYMEPGKAYVTNASAIAETDKEYEKVRKMIEVYDYNIFCESRKNELDTLIKKLGDTLSDEFRVAPVGQAVAIRDKNIVYRLFPEWSDTITDGLANVRDLEPVYTKNENGEKGFLIPGVYHKEGYLLFAHYFFRRSLSILNTTNEEFFNSFEKMRENSTVELQLALDMDMIGLVGTEHPEMEYQYIRGPHFNDDLSRIPEGVTCHENEHYDNVFSNLISTQFYWHIQDGRRTFECEELCDRENVSFDEGKTMLWGCRYVHSMLNPDTGLPTHLDGAIRIYNDEQILERIDVKTDISKCGKISEYVKLWRVDNDFSVTTWKELISSFYRENSLIGEYFGGVDEKYDNIKKEGKERCSKNKRQNCFEHIELTEGDGVRIFFRYADKIELNTDRDIEIYNKSFVIRGDEKIELLDSETITLLKYLKRKGLNLIMPTASLIDCFDMIHNFPTIRCKNFNVADIVIEAIKELFEVWVRNKDDRLISFGLMVDLNDKLGHVSFAGQVNDFVKLFRVIPKMSDISFEEWIETIYKENNIFKIGGDCPNKFRLICGNALYFERIIISSDKIKKTWRDNDGYLHTQFNITKEEGDELIQHNITSSPFYIIHEERCEKCELDYAQCTCVKFIDKNISTKVTKAELLGMIWTNRNVLNQNGQLELIKEI